MAKSAPFHEQRSVLWRALRAERPADRQASKQASRLGSSRRKTPTRSSKLGLGLGLRLRLRLGLRLRAASRAQLGRGCISSRLEPLKLAIWSTERGITSKCPDLRSHRVGNCCYAHTSEPARRNRNEKLSKRREHICSTYYEGGTQEPESNERTNERTIDTFHL